MPVQISVVVLTIGLGIIRLLPMQFELDGNNQVTVNTNIPVQIINALQFLLNTIVTAAHTNQDLTEALCRLLALAFRIISLLIGDNGAFRENLVVMVIDGALSLGNNPLTASNHFNQHDITLAVVAAATPRNEVRDYYSTLASYTGGEYMLLRDAGATLGRVISAVIHGEDTLRQAFHPAPAVNVPLVIHPPNDMNEQIQETDGVGELDFDHGLPQ